MTLFDFFRAKELPAPEVSVTDAAEIARQQFGLECLPSWVSPLGSQQDANFLLSAADGAPIGVLKVANPAFGRVEIEAQDAAARFIAAAEPLVRTAETIETPGINPLAGITDAAGHPVYARIISFLGGGSISGERYVSSQHWAALGTLAGRASRALAGFDHPGVDRVLQWDLQHSNRTIDVLKRYVSDPGRRSLIETASAGAWQAVSAVAAQLPRQVIHGDITDDNVVCAPTEGGLPNGIIDFGDLTRSWAIGELAVAASSVLRHAGGEPATALALIEAFHRERPLQAAEIAALWPLVVLRAATLVVSGNQQTAIDADNEYATSALESEWQIFERSISVPIPVMTGLIVHALGTRAPTARPTPAEPAPLLPGIDITAIRRLDFSVDADALDAGAWLQPDCEEKVAADAVATGATAAATAYGQPRLTRSVALESESPATVPTGIDVWLAATTALAAPWAALVAAVTEHEVVLSGEDGILHIRGSALTPSASVRVGHALTAGDELGTAAGRVWVQISGREAVPAFVRPEYAPGWLALSQDPSPLLGLPPAAEDAATVEDSQSLLKRRGQSFAAVQEQYYSDPPRIERGWREYLLDTDGRSYLDMVNNVAALGHGHPQLADAVARQWRRLNTNSRFNYRAVVEFSERLAATLPDPLNTVFLVNSGSEAVDLALRLAFATTGHRSVVAVREAYHGWTYATDAISTSVADNPNALATRPEWVHTVPSPNSFRGDHRGQDAAKYAPEAVQIIEDIAARGHPPAAFICEPFYGNAGGVALPDGYLGAVYTAVRAAGGLAIADEVQVGYGRLGSWFWGFQGQGVIPDIVTVAKAMGNGQPLGAVITTRAIAQAYRTEGYFFSSAGGSPVSSVVGLTVLDVIEREGLQANALTVGDHLKSRLAELAERHPLIGAVHGSGLYMGVELVRDRETLEPAVLETAAICERMRELGVIVQPTGDHMCVLKMKPPMCISVASADYFIDMLDRVLTTGW